MHRSYWFNMEFDCHRMLDKTYRLKCLPRPIFVVKPVKITLLSWICRSNTCFWSLFTRKQSALLTCFHEQNMQLGDPGKHPGGLLKQPLVDWQPEVKVLSTAAVSLVLVGVTIKLWVAMDVLRQESTTCFVFRIANCCSEEHCKAIKAYFAAQLYWLPNTILEDDQTKQIISKIIKCLHRLYTLYLKCCLLTISIWFFYWIIIFLLNLAL